MVHAGNRNLIILLQAETDGIHGSAQTGNLGHVLLVAVVIRGILADDRIHCIRISLDGFRHAVLIARTVVEICMRSRQCIICTISTL